jgi:aminodeoxyfutalosine deaminase
LTPRIPIEHETSELSPKFSAFIRRLPKVELHVHLEGSLRPGALRELGARNGRPAAELEAWLREREETAYRYGNFRAFIEAFKFSAMLLQQPRDYGFAAEELFRELASQGVRYAEVTLSAGVVLWRKQPLEAVFEAVQCAAQAAETRWGIRIQWIFDAIRQFGEEPAQEVLKWARLFRDRGVVGFGIGGDELQAPADRFAKVYREARESGLRLTAHAGESGGSESVVQAVTLLGAERIGHGLAAAADERAMELLAECQIPLEVCISSNVSTGVLRNFHDHPLRRLMAAGIPITLNSDDPGLFGTTLEHEIVLAALHFGLKREEIVQFCRNAIQYSFLAREQKDVLAKGIEAAARGTDLAEAET